MIVLKLHVVFNALNWLFVQSRHYCKNCGTV